MSLRYTYAVEICSMSLSFHVVSYVQMSRFVEAINSIESVLGCRRGIADDYVLRAKIRWALGMVSRECSRCVCVCVCVFPFSLSSTSSFLLFCP